jgi:hypothetical protein
MLFLYNNSKENEKTESEETKGIQEKQDSMEEKNVT